MPSCKWTPEQMRSLLFVPVLNDRFIAAAHARGADGLIFDLEDSIALERKIDARHALATAVARLRPHGLALLVRVNHMADLFDEDLCAAAAAGVDAIIIPKVEHPETLVHASQVISSCEGASWSGLIQCIALIESPLGVLNASRIAQSADRLCGLAFGGEDYAAVLGLAAQEESLTLPAQQLAIAARAYGLGAWGLPGSIADFSDLDAFEVLVRKAKAYGFMGALGIHPGQIERINRAFRASDSELVHARAVVQAYETALARGEGAVALQGKMIDAPIAERARRLLQVQLGQASGKLNAGR